MRGLLALAVFARVYSFFPHSLRRDFTLARLEKLFCEMCLTLSLGVVGLSHKPEWFRRSGVQVFFVVRVFASGQAQFAHSGSFASVEQATAKMVELSAIATKFGFAVEHIVHSAEELNAMPRGSVGLYGY